MGEIHSVWGWVAVVLCGLAGLFGIILAVLKSPANRAFQVAVGVGVAALVIQIVLGLISMNLENIQPGDQHVFYGIVIAFTLGFAYIYRGQLDKRATLYQGLMMLFLMGLGIRGIVTLGLNF